MPASSAAGLAPSAASEFISSELKTEIKPDELSDFAQPGSASQVKDKDGVNTNEIPNEEGAENGVWINADPIPGCVVCNIGESKRFPLLLYVGTLKVPNTVWEIWTNGLYKSTLHRVIHRGSNYRFVALITSLLVKNLSTTFSLLACRKFFFL